MSTSWAGYWTQAQWRNASVGFGVGIQAARPWVMMITDILHGLDALKLRREVYLPRNADETETAYQRRLDEAEMTNIFGEAVEDLAAKPFAREIRVTDADPSTLAFCEDVDGEGNHLHVFAHRLLETAIAYGRAHILVEYPELPEGATLLDEQQAGGLTWTIIQQPQVMQQGDDYFRFAYSEPFRDENGLEDTRMIVREYQQADGVVMFRETVGLDGTIRVERTLPIAELPIATVTLGKVLWELGGAVRPPLLNAAQMQLALYRSENALRFAERMTAFPMLVARGITPPTAVDPNYPERGARPVAVRVGPNQVLYAPPGIGGQIGGWEYLEPSAQSLVFLAGRVDALKADIREAVRQPLVAGTAGTTQVAALMASQRSASSLQVWARLTADCIENAFVLSRQWVADMSEASVSLYTDFDIVAQSDASPQLLFQMEQAGRLSLGTLYAELRRRNILGDTFDAEREEAELGPLEPPGMEPAFGAPDDPTVVA